MTGLSDEEMRARFDSLRRVDEQRAPAFRAILDRPVRAASAGTPFRARWRLAVALSLAAGVVLVAGLVRVSRRRDFVAQPLSTWTSPTASLLRTQGAASFATSPLLPSVLDNLTVTTLQRRGRRP
jgi:hypothetical protein